MGKKIQPRIYKGTRDFLPEQMIKRNYVIDIVKREFEKYGFEPLETPTMELWETLSGKYGEEGDRLTYRFVDRGGREVGLRYDLTVPLSRVIAMHPQLPKPFKRYQIQPVWRADKPQKGRFREFYQCDVDIVGSPSMLADAEILSVSHSVLKALSFENFIIRVNNRKILSGIVEVCQVPKEKEFDIYRAIDKLDKIGFEGVEEELEKKGLDKKVVNKLFEILSIDGDNVERLKRASDLLKESSIGTEGIEELQQLFAFLEAYEIPQTDVKFDLFLARGLDYYTGPIYETVLSTPRIGSITGGGRYDKLIGLFSGQDFPATGSSIGLERIITVMDELNMFPEHLNTSTQVLVTIFDETLVQYSIQIARKLREAGINCDLYTGKSKLRGQFGLANDKKIPFVVIAGPDEANESKATIKNMISGEQTVVMVQEISEKIREQLKSFNT